MAKPQRVFLAGLILAGILLFLAGCSSDSSDAANAPVLAPVPTTVYTNITPAHILIIHAYHPEYRWEQELNLGILAGLAAGGYSEEAGNVVLDYFWMDTKRNNDPDYIKRISAEAIQHIERTQPDIVIGTDDNTMRNVILPASEQMPDIPFVFAGLNGKLQSYGIEDRTNVTGVLETLHVDQTLNWIEAVLPDAKRLTFLFDGSETSIAYRADVQQGLVGSAYFGAQILMTNSFAEWQGYVEQAAADSDALVVGVYHTLRGADDKVVDSVAAMQWASEISPIPIVGLWDFGVIDGALGGSVISGDNQGFEAAQIVTRILNGEAPNEIAVVSPRRGKLSLNSAAVDRWHVNVPMDLIEVSTIY